MLSRNECLSYSGRGWFSGAHCADGTGFGGCEMGLRFAWLLDVKGGCCGGGVGLRCSYLSNADWVVVVSVRFQVAILLYNSRPVCLRWLEERRLPWVSQA